MKGSESVSATWGTTPAERAMRFPCDALLPNPGAALYRAVTVNAAPAHVFRWLCQLRAAPYSYDWIDNYGRRSPPQLTPGLEHLAVGQSVMSIFTLVEFERDSHLTLRTRAGDAASRIFGNLVATYLVRAERAGSCRLIVKILAAYPPGPIGQLGSWVLPWGDLVMMRRQLLNLKQLAESTGEKTAPV